ncbi:DUF3592 domain-containing protein [Streptomyces beihaiensis]|uniref:DUF3592 domain-containing protein n=1 Tax=Streptomyces beihaiensis TaxID=2984495 RepID=A0ABT3U2Y7_9ACTN|nr:DUF3592 domain-containing protein [Streptomyces beihaiensis]MCX3063677.1 DUF3592 domain-containing protein [Streptomyces beihaiensis]
MAWLFYAIPTIIGGGALCVRAVAVRRHFELYAAWRSGLTAQGRCLRAYTTTRGGDSPSTRRHHVYEFATRDGRAVRFDEAGGPATTVEGDAVVVYYTAARPERATAGRPRPVWNAVGVVAVVVFVGLVVSSSVFFMVSFSDAFGR